MSSPIPGFFDPSDETVSIPTGQLPGPLGYAEPAPEYLEALNHRGGPRHAGSQRPPDPRDHATPPWAASQPRSRSAGRARREGVPLAQVLAVLAMIALPLGLFLPDNGRSFWSGAQAWSLFAIACGLVQLVPLAGTALGLADQRAWRLAVASAGGLLVFWVLLVLPSIESNAAFALTVATGSAIGGVWLSPGRHR
ncbi:MAG: hypothetical protein HYR62_02255 [Actinobacteria bacterium]|nr:hypothetical protein [Actinomycetota bacterium]MBI3687303.1 hypothetical protein [Actinomycetota bacterium]